MRALLGDLIFGVDDQTMETVVLDHLRARGMTLAVAEAVTGGIMASRLSDIDPAMEVFRGGTIATWADDADGAPPQAEARAMAAATSVQAAFGADVGISAVTPVAAEGELPGAVFLALAIGDRRHGDRISLPGDRRRMRNYVGSHVHAKGASLAGLVSAVQPEASWSCVDIATGAGHTAIAFAPPASRTCWPPT